jgi:hypothetical protein
VLEARRGEAGQTLVIEGIFFRIPFKGHPTNSLLHVESVLWR